MKHTRLIPSRQLGDVNGPLGYQGPYVDNRPSVVPDKAEVRRCKATHDFSEAVLDQFSEQVPDTYQP